MRKIGRKIGRETGRETPQRAAPHPYRWTMLAGVWLVYFSFGLTAAALPPLVGRIVDDLGMSLSGMGTVLGAWPLVYVAVAIPGGILVDRLGLRWSLALAALVIAFSGFLRAGAEGAGELFLAVAVFGLGGPLVSIGAPKLISVWFAGQERGLAIGIYITGPALGGVLALSLTNSLLMPLTAGSWRAVLLLYAAVAFAVGAIWLLICAHPAYRSVEREGAAFPRERPLAAFLRIGRAPAVQLVLVMSVGIFFFNHGLNAWLPEILRRGGMAAAQAGHWAAVPTAVGILGSLTIPRIATKARRVPILLGLFLCAGTATFLIRADPGALLGLGLFAQGVARSAMMPLLVLVLVESPEVGERHAGTASGLFFSVGEMGGVLGPLGVGYLAERTGGFSAALWMLAGVCALLSLLLPALARATRTRSARSD